jgi:hypothetical protein
LYFEGSGLLVTRIDVSCTENHRGWNNRVVVIKITSIIVFKLEVDVVRKVVVVVKDDVMDIIRNTGGGVETGVCKRNKTDGNHIELGESEWVRMEPNG